MKYKKYFKNSLIAMETLETCNVLLINDRMKEI